MSGALEFWHHHGGISVPDLDASIAWWTKVLGFEAERRGADIVWVKVMPHGSNIFIRDNAGNLLEFVQEARPQEPCAAL